MKGSQMDTDYVLTSGELTVLLSAVGCEKFYGFSLAGLERMDRETLLRELHGLFQKGFLRQKDSGEKLEVDPELLPLLHACADSKQVLRISVLYPEQKPFAVCYPGEIGWTVLRPCEQMPDGWLLQWRNVYGIPSMLEDYELLPRSDDELQREQEKLSGYRDADDDQTVPLIQFEWLDGKTGAPVDELTVSRGILTYRMQTSTERQAYMAERLNEWMALGCKETKPAEREGGNR